MGENPPISNRGKYDAPVQTNSRGEARLKNLASGSRQIHIEAPGFKSHDLELDLHSGANRHEITLAIDPIKVDVEVSEEARVRNSDPNGPAFANVMTADQIAQLPDDPDEFENAIKKNEPEPEQDE